MLASGRVTREHARSLSGRIRVADENWDNWMRLDTVANGRECIVPEVNRNFNFGSQGANMNINTYKRLIERMGYYEVHPDALLKHRPLPAHVQV